MIVPASLYKEEIEKQFKQIQYSETNIDFHTIANTAIAFNDIYINMSNVDFIKKDIADEALKSVGEENR